MNQNQIIIETLVHHAGKWVGAGYLANYNNRDEFYMDTHIELLRAKGYNIEHRRNPVSDNSEYKVTGKAVQV